MRKRLLVAGAVLVAVLAAGAVLAERLFHVTDLIHIGAGYTAAQTCACLFISHRSAPSCRGDLEPLARWFVSVTPGPDTVTARSFLVSRATARYEKGFGCTLEN